MAGEAVARNGGPLPFSIALMALGAVGERVHTGQGEARPAMDLERLHVVPSSGRMATVASAAQPRLMRIAVTVATLSGDPPLAAMALITSRGIVSPGEWEAGSGVIEAFSRLSPDHLPARRGMAVPAIHPFGNRIVASSPRASCFPIRIFGDGDPRNGRESGDAKPDDQSAAHRPPFRRACGLA